MSYSKIETILKKEKKKKFYSLCPLSRRLGHRQTSTGLHITVATDHWHHAKVRGSSPGLCSMHSLSQNHAIHSYPAPFSLLAWHPNLFFFNSPSRNQSISSAATSTLSYIGSLSNPIILHPHHMAEPPENTIINSFVTPHNYLIYAFGTLSTLLISSKLLRLSICTNLILDLSFSFHNIVSLPEIRIGTDMFHERL